MQVRQHFHTAALCLRLALLHCSMACALPASTLKAAARAGPVALPKLQKFVKIYSELAGTHNSLIWLKYTSFDLAPGQGAVGVAVGMGHAVPYWYMHIAARERKRPDKHMRGVAAEKWP